MLKLKNDKIVKLAYLIGGIYDLILGLGLVFFADFMIKMMDVSKPDKMIFVHLSGIFLIVIGYFLLYSIPNVKYLAFIGFSSGVLRFSYASIVLFTYISIGIEDAYLLTALTDILTGLFLIISLLLTEGISWKQIYSFNTNK